MFRDEWSLLDANDNPIGTVKEDSGLMSIIRRFFIKIIPQTFRVDQRPTGRDDQAAVQPSARLRRLPRRPTEPWTLHERGYRCATAR